MFFSASLPASHATIFPIATVFCPQLVPLTALSALCTSQDVGWHLALESSPGSHLATSLPSEQLCLWPWRGPVNGFKVPIMNTVILQVNDFVEFFCGQQAVSTALRQVKASGVIMVISFENLSSIHWGWFLGSLIWYPSRWELWLFQSSWFWVSVSALYLDRGLCMTCDVLVGLAFWPFCDLAPERCTSMPCPATVSVFRYLLACVLKLWT